MIENLINISSFQIVISFVRCGGHSKPETRDKIVHDAFVTGSRTVVSFISVCQHRSNNFFLPYFRWQNYVLVFYIKIAFNASLISFCRSSINCSKLDSSYDIPSGRYFALSIFSGFFNHSINGVAFFFSFSLPSRS